MNFFLSPKGMADLNTAGSIEQNYPFSSSDLDANQIPFRNRTDRSGQNSYQIAVAGLNVTGCQLNGCPKTSGPAHFSAFCKIEYLKGWLWLLGFWDYYIKAWAETF